MSDTYMTKQLIFQMSALNLLGKPDKHTNGIINADFVYFFFLSILKDKDPIRLAARYNKELYQAAQEPRQLNINVNMVLSGSAQAPHSVGLR